MAARRMWRKRGNSLLSKAFREALELRAGRAISLDGRGGGGARA